jgi:acetylornithine deacetylase/succinyl-diaminopimelate desuccinylase-like protein
MVASLAWAEPPEAKDAKAEAAALDQKVLEAAKKDPEIMANLTHLSDVIGPRLTGSAAVKKANQWTAEKMKAYGLENVELEPWTIPAGWERGPAAARVVEPDNGRTLLLASAGWTPGTKGKVTGDVVVITARNSKDLEKYKGKLKDAIVLQGAPANVRPITEPGGLPGARPTPPPETKPDADKKPDTEKKPEGATTEAQPPRPDFEQMRAFRRELAEFLRTEGAAVLLHDAGKPHGLLTTTGGWRGNDRVSAPEPLPSAYVAHEHYALLHRLATRPEPARTRVEIEISNKMTPGPITVYNTVGEIKGSEKPDEYVILGAHLDSWDLAQGTTDNGTGSCVVLEAARMLVKSGVKPKRTIRFVLFTGEEQGLYGSKAYVQKHKDELPKVSLCLVHDTGTGKVVGIGTQGREPVKPILEAELTSLKELGLKEINLRSMGGSDHQSFEAAGVPGFAVQQDMSEYRLTHHSQSDTLDKAKEADLIQGAQVMAVTALRVANLPDLLPRAKKVEEKKGP